MREASITKWAKECIISDNYVDLTIHNSILIVDCVLILVQMIFISIYQCPFPCGCLLLPVIVWYGLCKVKS